MGGSDTIDVSIEVPVPAARAFQLFTADLDRWWLRGPKHRFASPWTTGTLRLEPGAQGRLTEHYPSGEIIEIGRVLSWEPPLRFALEWRLPNFGAGERTHVEVRFEPTARGCRVRVLHSGWESLPREHPARHGLTGLPLWSMKASLWRELCNAFRTYVREQHDKETAP